ncbi:alkyl sulfatase C-terminal domain-containing protein [Streptomyces prunicolor]|uniref:alkyl sulfatase C-terminal domain-containing protein n=1 Tax=Streptomyces prunicolor TaxID=67348 RepID=UPI00386D563A
MKHGVLTRTSGASPNPFAGPTLTMNKVRLLRLLAGKGLGTIQVSGDVTLLTTLFSVVVTPAADFNIVTRRATWGCRPRRRGGRGRGWSSRRLRGASRP